jgi:hypothetical protein
LDILLLSKKAQGTALKDLFDLPFGIFKEEKLEPFDAFLHMQGMILGEFVSPG